MNFAVQPTLCKNTVCTLRNNGHRDRTTCLDVAQMAGNELHPQAPNISRRKFVSSPVELIAGHSLPFSRDTFNVDTMFSTHNGVTTFPSCNFFR